MANNKLIIIDAFSQIYRGYYAVRALSNSKNQPTNAVFALAKFLLKLYKEHPSDQGIFVFDAGKPQFRLDLAPDYKANRSPMPDDMKVQMPYIEKMIKAFGWPEIREVGYEADDLVAAIAKDSKQDEVYIITSDKDVHQVVDDHIKIMVPDRKQGFEYRGRDEVIDRFQVTPEQIVDYLAMIGDSSDNIPGLAGVGPKTAVKLLQQFGSIKNMLKKADEISNAKLRDKVKSNSELLEKNIALVTLKTDTANRLWLKEGALIRREPDWHELAKIFTELELKSLYNEIIKLSDHNVVEEEFIPEQDNSDDLFAFSAKNSQENKKESPEIKTENAHEHPDLF